MQRNTKPARECPLFPLTVNVLPGGFLPLQIFEPRYLDMISNCLGKEKGFSIVLLQAQVGGLQKDSIPNHFTVGTYVEVVDFNQLENGLLGITVKGKNRIKVIERWSKKKDDLIMGSVINFEEEEESVSLEPKYENIWNLLREISSHPKIKSLDLDIDFKCSSSVVYNLASLLPLTPPDRQTLLETKSNTIRLDHLNQLVTKYGG